MTPRQSSTATLVVALAVAGIVGAALRWGVGAVWYPRGALLVANIVGCFLTGTATLTGSAVRTNVMVTTGQPSKSDKLSKRDWVEQRETGVWFTVGLCGAITSFSAVVVELAADIDKGQFGTAGLWLGATVVGCALGFCLPRWASSCIAKFA